MAKRTLNYDLAESLIHSNYLNYFRDRILNADKLISVSILGSMDSILKESFYRLGYNLDIEYLKCIGSSKNGIHFSLYGSVLRGTDSFTKLFLKENGMSKKLFFEIINNNKVLKLLLGQKSNRNISLIEIGKAIGIQVDVNIKEGYLYKKSDTHIINFFIPLNQFPNIKKEVEEFFLLEDKHFLYNAEKSRIISEYEIERFPYILMSDIKYSVMNFEIEKLASQRDELNLKLSRLVSRAEERSAELYEEDSINMKRVDESFNFDKDRYLILKEYIQYSNR